MSKYNTMSDHELVELYEQGIDEAFDLLLARNQEHVFAYIMRLTQNAERANDIFQETFMKAVVCIRNHQYKCTGKFSAWLMRIAHNLVIDLKRGGRFIAEYDVEDLSDVLYNNQNISQESCEAEMLRHADHQMLAKLIALLPMAQQEIVHLRFYEELSFKEIAQILGISINTALGRMRYATINLRKMITEHSLELAV
jgi:RNA polymerase sigma-70 factor (ECF subfamily)